MEPTGIGIKSEGFDGEDSEPTNAFDSTLMGPNYLKFEDPLTDLLEVEVEEKMKFYKPFFELLPDDTRSLAYTNYERNVYDEICLKKTMFDEEYYRCMGCWEFEKKRLENQLKIARGKLDAGVIIDSILSKIVPDYIYEKEFPPKVKYVTAFEQSLTETAKILCNRLKKLDLSSTYEEIVELLTRASNVLTKVIVRNHVPLPLEADVWEMILSEVGFDFADQKIIIELTKPIEMNEFGQKSKGFDGEDSEPKNAFHSTLMRPNCLKFEDPLTDPLEVEVEEKMKCYKSFFEVLPDDLRPLTTAIYKHKVYDVIFLKNKISSMKMTHTLNRKYWEVEKKRLENELKITRGKLDAGVIIYSLLSKIVPDYIYDKEFPPKVKYAIAFELSLTETAKILYNRLKKLGMSLTCEDVAESLTRVSDVWAEVIVRNYVPFSMEEDVWEIILSAVGIDNADRKIIIELTKPIEIDEFKNCLPKMGDRYLMCAANLVSVTTFSNVEAELEIKQIFNGFVKYIGRVYCIEDKNKLKSLAFVEWIGINYKDIEHVKEVGEKAVPGAELYIYSI